MKDIKITEKNTFVMKDNDFVLVDGDDRIRQHIRTGLMGILPGTWLLDAKAGIDWFSGLSTYVSILQAQIKNAIKTVNGVSLLRKFKFDDSDYNCYKVSGLIVENNNDLNFSEEISWN